MNVLQFADFSPPYEGNFLKSLKALSKKLGEENSPMVYVFTKNAACRAWARELADRGEAFFLTGNPLKDVFLFKKIIKERDIDIVHTHFSLQKYDVLINAARRLSAKKTLYIRHMHMLYRRKTSPFLERIKQTISNADIEIACSRAVYEAMTEAGFKSENLFTVTNGIDFSALDHWEAIDRKALGIGEDAKIVLMFGYHYFVKGVDIAINAVSELARRGEKTVLAVVDVDNPDSAARKLRERFTAAPAFIKLLAPRGDVASYYRFADVFLSASRAESFCFALREAAYCGCLTVASDIPAHKMGARDISFKSGDCLDLQNKLIFALHAENRAEIAAAQKAFVLKNYAIEKWRDEILEIYQKNKPKS